MKLTQTELNELPADKCICGHTFFKSVIIFKRASRFFTGDIEDKLIPLQIYICNKCETIRPEQADVLNSTIRVIPPTNGAK